MGGSSSPFSKPDAFIAALPTGICRVEVCFVVDVVVVLMQSVFVIGIDLNVSMPPFGEIGNIVRF